MSYTFGGATGDDITAGSAVSGGGDNSNVFFCGWFYPTTLTATRGYCSIGNIHGMEVDTTTSELRFRSDNTTDGQYTTTGAGIAVNQWHFIAYLGAFETTGTLAAWRVWVGTEQLEPIEITPAVAVAPSGSFTGATSRFLGNKGNASTAFQGQVGWGFWLACGPGTNNPISIETSGVINTWQADFVRERLVNPIWRGVAPSTHIRQASTGSYSYLLMALDRTPALVYEASAVTTAIVHPAITINGATYSNNQPPVRSEFLQRWLMGSGNSRILRRL